MGTRSVSVSAPVHTESLDWFLSGSEWILNSMLRIYSKRDRNQSKLTVCSFSVVIWRDFLLIFSFFQIKVHDFEYQTYWRWFQGWLHKMAIYDNPHLGWISQRKMVPWGRFQKQRFLFQIVKISCLNLFCLRVANWYSVFVETDKTIHSKLNYLCYLRKLGCPERGPAQGTPTRDPDVLEVGAGRGWLYKTPGCPEAGLRRSLEGQGRAVLSSLEPDPRSRPGDPEARPRGFRGRGRSGLTL